MGEGVVAKFMAFVEACGLDRMIDILDETLAQMLRRSSLAAMR